MEEIILENLELQNTLIKELLEIMDEECQGYEEWEKNKPTIINIYIGSDE